MGKLVLSRPGKVIQVFGKVLKNGFCCPKQEPSWLVAWRSGNAFHPLKEVTLRRAGLVLRWVTVCGQVNHLSM